MTFLLTILCLTENCSSAKTSMRQSKDAALVSFFINELWDEPDCGEKQITIRQDTTDGLKYFLQRMVKDKVTSFQLFKFNSNDIFHIAHNKNIKIKPYIYRLATGDDEFPLFPLEENECKSVILNGIYHFKTFSVIVIDIEAERGLGNSALFKYKIQDNKIQDIQLLTYIQNRKKDAKKDLRKKYPMYEVPKEE